MSVILNSLLGKKRNLTVFTIASQWYSLHFFKRSCFGLQGIQRVRQGSKFVINASLAGIKLKVDKRIAWNVQYTITVQ